MRRLLVLLVLLAAAPVAGQPVASMSAGQLLEWAGTMEAAGRLDLAQRALAALTKDPSRPIRQEARFRLAQMDVQAGRLAEAARLYRAILDEEPDVQRVRLELARTLDAMGDEAGARKALREAQAAGLPPDVARFVDRYAAALRARKPFGVSFDLALAPDSNINRSPRSDTIGTVIGDFDLSPEAQQTSGVGAALRAQAFVRLPLSAQANMLARATGSADLYDSRAFNDVSLAASLGPEVAVGRDRWAVQLGGLWRRFGGEPYSTSLTANVTWLHPVSRTAQIRVTLGLAAIDNLRNDLLDGGGASLALSYERALSARSGIGGAIVIDRQALNDPGWSTTSGQLSAFGYRDFGALTAVGQLSMGRLEADERLNLFPERRSDRSIRGSLTFTLRELTIGQLAPLLRVTAERNASTVDLYEYRRLRTEVGVTRAF